MDTLFIVNPSAHKGDCLKRWLKLEKALRQISSFSFSTHLTSRPGEAREVAERSASSFQRIIAVGGDGTLNEVVNGVAGQNVTLGVIPFGTGNDFARVLGVPKETQPIVDMIVQNQTQRVDVGQVNDTYFLNAAGTGFDGLIAHDVNQKPTLKRLGALGYVASMVKQWTRFRPFHIRMTLDGREFDVSDVWLVAVGNGQYYGGGMKVCPNANTNDGLLDVCLAHGIGRFRFLQIMPSVYSGNHLRYSRYVYYTKATRVYIESTQELPGHADGELISSSQICIQVTNIKFPFLVPGS